MKNGCHKSITWILDTFLLLNSFGPIINGLNHYSKEAEELNKFHRIFFILKNIVLTPWYHWHSWFKHPGVWLRTIKDIAAIFKFYNIVLTLRCQWQSGSDSAVSLTPLIQTPGNQSCCLACPQVPFKWKVIQKCVGEHFYKIQTKVLNTPQCQMGQWNKNKKMLRVNKMD